MPSADYFRPSPHYTTRYWVISSCFTRSSDSITRSGLCKGGNFGLFGSHELMKQLNAKIYVEAKRLGVKWILGGEIGRGVAPRPPSVYGHDEWAGGIFWKSPFRRSPARGSTKRALHAHGSICEFTADLLHHHKLKLDPGRNDCWKVTFHNFLQSLARAMGLLEEPRYILRQVCRHFYEMPDTIREHTFCCGPW